MVIVLGIALVLAGGRVCQKIIGDYMSRHDKFKMHQRAVWLHEANYKNYMKFVEVYESSGAAEQAKIYREAAEDAKAQSLYHNKMKENLKFFSWPE